MKIDKSKMSYVARELARSGLILDQTIKDGEEAVFCRPPQDRDERRLVKQIQEKYGVRENPPKIDPEFPERPDHPDFWKLSKIVIENDDATEAHDGFENAVGAAGIDVGSVVYMARQRAARFCQYMDLPEEHVGKVIAAIIDGFITGVRFEQEKQLGFHPDHTEPERNEMTTTKVCPRCRGYIPNNDTPGLYMGAISRWDNETEVCSACGTEEAFEQLGAGVGYNRGGHVGVTPPEKWPVVSDRRRVDDVEPVDSEHRRQALDG